MFSRSVKFLTISLSYQLATPNTRSHCCRLTKSVRPGLSPPESCHVTVVTVSPVMSIGENSGDQSGYEYRLAAVGSRAYRCLECSTSITRSPVLVHCYPGWRTPPVSRFVIHLTAVPSFPQISRLWNVCARCSAVSSLSGRQLGTFDEHHVLAVPQRVQALLNPLSDGVGCGDMLVPLQYHCLEDNEPLQVPQSVPHKIIHNK